MEIDKIIDQVIDEVLKKKKQPFMNEFKTFIKHVMSDQYDETELEYRINAIKLKEEEKKE